MRGNNNPLLLRGRSQQSGSNIPNQGNGINGDLSYLVQKFAELEGKLSSRILDIESALEALMIEEGSLSQFPEQFKAGQVAYPDRYPFPMVLSVELRTAAGERYGATNDVVRASIQVDIDNPTFVPRISFDLFKPDIEGNVAPIGIYLPLSGQRIVQWNPAQVYPGRDFRWRIQTSSDDRQWQTGWRSSAMLDGTNREGYILPTEYELRRNDTLLIEAQPIGPIVQDQEWELTVHLHVYKMLLRRE